MLKLWRLRSDEPVITFDDGCECREYLALIAYDLQYTGLKVSSEMSSRRAPSIEEIRSVSNISQHLLERLVAEIPAKRILEGIKEMLSATFITKSGKSHPDYRAREAGLKLYMSYAIGLPVQRQIIANVTHPSSKPDEDPWSSVRDSPAARRALRAKLEEFEKATSL